MLHAKDRKSINLKHVAANVKAAWPGLLLPFYVRKPSKRYNIDTLALLLFHIHSTTTLGNLLGKLQVRSDSYEGFIKSQISFTVTLQANYCGQKFVSGELS